MKGNYSFREPLDYDDQGLYITAAQMQFFLNRPGGSDSFRKGTKEFISYYNFWLQYNLVYDLSELFPEDVYFYWCPEEEQVKYSCPKGGFVDEQLSSIELYDSLEGFDFDEE